MKRRMRKGASSVGNVIRIVRSDFKRLFANAMSVIIVIGLVVMPSIFAWYNVIACWNVFDNTGNLTVAVANVDDGYESDLVPLRVNIGERVVSALRANDQIDWTFTTEEDAVDGARSGRYYAAVVIPAGFSKDMLTFYSEDVQHARIVYYANEKKSAIAPKITDQGADSVSYQVNEVFAQTLSEVALGIAESMSAYADEADVGGRIAGVSGKVRDMGAQADRMASVLELYSSLAGAAQTLASDSGELVAAAQRGVDGLDAASSQGSTSASDLVTAVKGSVDDLAGALDGAAARFDEVSASAGALFDAASTGAAHGAAGGRGPGATTVRSQAPSAASVAAAHRPSASSTKAGSTQYRPGPVGAAGEVLSALVNAARTCSSDTDALRVRPSVETLRESAAPSLTTGTPRRSRRVARSPEASSTDTEATRAPEGSSEAMREAQRSTYAPIIPSPTDSQPSCERGREEPSPHAATASSMRASSASGASAPSRERSIARPPR